MRAVLRAITQILDRDTRPPAAACFEVRTPAHAGLLLADDYFDATTTAEKHHEHHQT